MKQIFTQRDDFPLTELEIRLDFTDKKKLQKQMIDLGTIFLSTMTR